MGGNRIEYIYLGFISTVIDKQSHLCPAPNSVLLFHSSKLSVFGLVYLHAFLYYIGEILRGGTQNLSYIYGNAVIDIAYPYAMLLSHTI